MHHFREDILLVEGLLVESPIMSMNGETTRSQRRFAVMSSFCSEERDDPLAKVVRAVALRRRANGQC